MYSCTINAYDWLTSESLQKVKIKAVNTAASSMHLSVSGLCSIYVVF